ncbi:MAG: prolyl oligopeptidase family serine peptidase, partial [Wenzhouxiangella sp.]|nr:prolyl oligopeptidase family serine peptidase [Wenzhouxiangella sp.]
QRISKMTRRFSTIVLLVSALLATGFAHAEQISAESLAKIPNIQSVSISADGEHLAAIIALPGSDNSETALATWELDNMGQDPEITPSGDKMKFIAASALKAGRMLVLGRQEWTGRLGGCGEGKISGATRTFVTKAYLTDAEHEEFEEAFAQNVRRIGISENTERCLELSGEANLVSNLPLDPHRVIIQQLNGLTLQGNYYLYDLRDGSTELLVSSNAGSSPSLFHPRTGEVLARSELESVDGEYVQRILLRNDEGEFEVHDKLTTKLSERHSVSIEGIDEESGKFYVLTDQFSNLVQARMYDPAKRDYDPEPLVAHDKYSISGLVFGNRQSNFNQLLGFRIAGPRMQTVYVDPTMRSIQEGLQQAFPDQHVSINGYTDEMTTVLFSTSSNRHPPTYHLLRDRQKVETIGNQRPWIDPEDIGKQRWVTYEARDGMEIPAILDLPAGWEKGDEPLPTIIHPHGGPWARDSMGWDASGWVPFLTSRGYAVLRPQYRGSAGLGRELWMAGDREWGKKMQDDKDDGAAWLVEQGIADEDRIAIFGYSYGGFAAVAATVRPDGPYNCAIAGAPVSDLGRLGVTWSDNRLQRILQGRTVTGMDPMRNTDKADIPILLYVGDRDVRTPSWHAENFYNAVKEHVPARFELVPDMPHSMPWYPRHQTQTLGLIEEFLSSSHCGMDTNA